MPPAYVYPDVPAQLICLSKPFEISLLVDQKPFSCHRCEICPSPLSGVLTCRKLGLAERPAEANTLNRLVRSSLLCNSALAALLGGASHRTLFAGGSPAEPAPEISIRIYNYADVPPEVIMAAQGEAARILSHSGVATRWQDCSSDRHPECQEAPGPVRLNIRILPVARIKLAGLPPDACAYSLVPARGFGVVASIFWRRVEELAKGLQVFQGLYLGHLLAHEIGHLLLADGGHSSAGIMRREWDLHDLSYAAQHKLLFNQRQADHMGAQLAERIHSEQAAFASEVLRLRSPDF
jgi:hypothetical protein